MRPVLGAQNPRIAELRRLIGRRSSRSGDIVIEGPRTIGEALDVGRVPSVVIVPEHAEDDASVAAVERRLPASVEFLLVRDHVFERLAPSTTPQPMLAIVARPAASLPATPSVVLVLAGVGDPGNLGTLVRAADAVAADSDLSTLATALEQTGLYSNLEGPGPVTLLAPTDEAFDRLSAILRGGGPQAERILSLDLKDLLEAHLIPGEVDLETTSGEVETGTVQSVAGTNFPVLYTPNDVVIDSSASIIDVESACNGAIAKIDAVLVPRSAPAPQPRPAPIDPADPVESPDFYFDDDYFGNPQVPPEEDDENCPRGTSECCDRRPPGQYSCAEQASWGKCAESWMRNGLYCRSTCGFCQGGSGGSG
ncbi:MAG TPA: hypothetical protein DCE75_04190, partial [Acidimicrobiaceae bacterium]|nr:hypothetical protein [Acidimicrobiaceae bacterium]